MVQLGTPSYIYKFKGEAVIMLRHDTLKLVFGSSKDFTSAFGSYPQQLHFSRLMARFVHYCRPLVGLGGCKVLAAGEG